MAKFYIRHVEHGKDERVVSNHKSAELAEKRLAKIADGLEAKGVMIRKMKYQFNVLNPEGKKYEFYQVVEFTRPGKYGINW